MTTAATEEALAKIKAILIEHDLWGCVTVSDDERTHWLYHFEPSWSCMHLNAPSGEVRIRAKKADFKTPEEHKRVVEQTASAVFNTRDYAMMLTSHMDIVATKLHETFDIEHHPFTDLKLGPL